MNSAVPQEAAAPRELRIGGCNDGIHPESRIYLVSPEGSLFFSRLRIDVGDKSITMTPQQWTGLGAEAETLRMALAACGVAAMCNTRESAAKHRLADDSPYRCASYNDVEKLVEREMALREQYDELVKIVRKNDERVYALQRLAMACPDCQGTGHIFRKDGCWDCKTCAPLRAMLPGWRDVMPMDAARDTKVVYCNPRNGGDGDVRHAWKTLRLGGVYTVRRTEVQSYSTRLYLAEHVGIFNHVQFALARPDEIEADAAYRASLAVPA
jgi:ribosomal protein L37AE/L43A